MGNFAKRMRWTWRTLWRSKQLEAEMQDEIRLHIEMEAERLRASGLDPAEAWRQALVRFGGVEKFKEEGREARGFAWLDSLSLDARLGIRMLAKHRWLTVVGGLAMAVAIALGATAFEVISVLLREDLPLPGGDRVVGIQYTTSSSASVDGRLLHAFAAWRGQVRSIEHLGAFRTAQHNLTTPNAPPEPVAVAEISASAFIVAGTPPLHGRYLLPSDEQQQAAPVLLIGYDAWHRRFGGDPAIVGRTVLVGGIPSTIVGIMPDGFEFPVSHQFWIPLRLDPLKWRPWEGPDLDLFGRLAPDVTVQGAQAELAAVGRQVADAHPDGAARLQPVVLPFTRAQSDLGGPLVVWLRAGQFLVGALSFLVAINLAVLLYARTITRLGEIAVRTALGASRGRILSQLFVEALVLTTLGAAAGLMISRIALSQVEAMAGVVPFWRQYSLGPSTVLYAFVLAVVAALIMGVLPGLKATGQRLSANLQELHGRSGTRLGSMWSTLIVAQVAVAVAILPAAVFLTWYVLRMEFTGRSVAVDRVALANMVLTDETSTRDAGVVRQRQDALMSRLRAEPGVTAVTFSSAVPGLGPDRRIEFPPSTQVRDAGDLDVASFQIDVELMRVYEARLLAGRGFEQRDVGTARAAIVNRTFVADLLALRSLGEGGEDSTGVLGTQFRYAAGGEGSAPSDWYEIVGVVEDFPGLPRAPGSGGEPTAYHPMASGAAHPAVLSIQYRDVPPVNMAERVRQIGAEIDPSMQMRRVVPLSAFYDEARSAFRTIALAVGFVTATVLLLSAAGVHAMMSFTIAQRTREIGIRSALGAQPRHLLFGIFRGAMRQLALGVLAGSLLSIGTFAVVGTGLWSASGLLVTVAVVMSVVALLAAIGPARRILRIQTVEALRMEG